MFKPRRIETSPDWLEPDGVKLYTIATRVLVRETRLREMNASEDVRQNVAEP
jgi:hypothetical protein